MNIIQLKNNNLVQVVIKTINVLKDGGLVIAPTDTVYGVLVDAKNEEAVQKLIQFKSRPKGKPISVFVENFKEAENYVKISKYQKDTLSNLLPGPFTIVLSSKHQTSMLLESEHKTLGIRIINFPFVNELTHVYKNPLTATSANITGTSPHYSISSFVNALPAFKKDFVDLIIDGGKLRRNKPSTVLDYSVENIKILRQGSGNIDKVYEYISHSVQETIEIAQNIWNTLKLKKNNKSTVLLLQGELGAGKTVFVKGIGKLFGKNDIISPSYTIVEEYEINNFGIKKLIHMDLYNVFKKEEYKFIGLKEYLEKGNLLCIEWGEKTGDIIEILKGSSTVILVKIEYVDEKRRRIMIIENF